MRTARFTAVLALGLAGPALPSDAPPPPLPDLTLDPSATIVMGVSSGGYMATQLAVAYPELFQGLAVFAAGPWGCAQGELNRALGQCMSTLRGLPERDALQARLSDYRTQGLVGQARALSGQRVYLWHGSADTTVEPALGEMLAEQYRDWLTAPESQLKVVRQADAGHGWPVDASVLSDSAEFVDCREGGTPYLLDCGLDGAGEALGWLYAEDGEESVKGESGEEETPLTTPTTPPPERLFTFDQSAFDDDLAEQGYLYVPQACESGRTCSLVVALHGCSMNAAAIGEAFMRDTSLNQWADTLGLVVLYPQATTSLANPLGCWDWWGYEESLWQPQPQHDSRAGKQLAGLVKMVRQLLDLPDGAASDS
ncbi:extracellular catalytic domain type 2 short-chain-length polyhydroxyalkanoate depolymerase [Onishia taeanensis]|nr:PHB depolymerase family esterase [Halomonas taeanensis]